MKNSFLKLKNTIFKILIELFILNKSKRSKLKARWAKKHLKKYLTPIEAENIQNDEPIIWQYWHQGEENAPELIKKCLESVRKFENTRKINVLSFETIKDYVELPQKYYDLVQSKKMPLAHFSDILRLYLLKQYGGIWIDSTIYLTDKIPDDIINSDFFVPQKDENKDNQENKMSCFFIRAKKGSANVQSILASLENYWKENDFVFNYFMFEHISTMLSNIPPCKEEWAKMPHYDAENSGELQKILYQKFDSETFGSLKIKTPIHKLTHKNLHETSPGNTFYDYLTNNFHKKKVSVVIPTLQKNTTILTRLINDLSLDESVSKIILIDNSLKGFEHNSKKLKVILPKENLYVNASWNFGTKEAQEEIVALLNDDIIIPKNFCNTIIHSMTQEMGIIGFNSGDFVKPVINNPDALQEEIKEENLTLEKTKYMDLYFGIAMFFYKSSYFEIPETMKIVYGDVWLYHKNLKAGRKNYRITGQTIRHWGSLTSSSKALSPICKNDAKIYKRLMIKWQDRIFSYDNIWNCYKLRLLGLTFKIPKIRRNK